MLDARTAQVLLFGSISTVADTSERQRRAYNEAFMEHGLYWLWERKPYCQMLAFSGGTERVAAYAADQGQQVDASAVHATKSEIFRRDLAEHPPPLRPGVAELIRQARQVGIRVGMVTTTSEANVRALLRATAPDLQAEDFEVVVAAWPIVEPKPEPGAYVYAMSEMGVSAPDCVAIEDNVGGVHAAVGAGVRCLAFPNENTLGHRFVGAQEVVDHIDLGILGLRA